MAVRPLRRSAPPAGPLLCPEGGQPLTSSPGLFRGHPTHRRAEVAVAGATLEIRPVLPGDALAIDRFVRSLSTITAYRRFHAPVPKLSAAQLAGIVDVDHHDRETLVALVRGATGTEITALAQYVRVSEDLADMAIVVADRWQRRGIGRVLAHHLGAAAAESGIVQFDATVLADNPAPQRLARGLSTTVDAARHGTTIDLHIPLQSAREELVGVSG